VWVPNCKEIFKNLTFFQKLKLRIFGNIELFENNPYGTGTLKYYGFICNKHGFTVNYPMGHYENLQCYACIKEEIDKPEMPRYIDA